MEIIVPVVVSVCVVVAAAIVGVIVYKKLKSRRRKKQQQQRQQQGADADQCIVEMEAGSGAGTSGTSRPSISSRPGSKSATPRFASGDEASAAAAAAAAHTPKSRKSKKSKSNSANTDTVVSSPSKGSSSPTKRTNLPIASCATFVKFVTPERTMKHTQEANNHANKQTARTERRCRWTRHCRATTWPWT